MYFCMACNLIETFLFRCYVFVIVCHHLLCMCDIVFKAQQDHCPAARPFDWPQKAALCGVSPSHTQIQQNANMPQMRQAP